MSNWDEDSVVVQSRLLSRHRLSKQAQVYNSGGDTRKIHALED